MHGKPLVPIALLCLAALPVLAFAAPQDPARIDGSQQADPANVFARPAPTRSATSSLADTARSMVPSGNSGTMDRVMQQAGAMTEKFPSFGMPSIADDYREAYGTNDVRGRMGRTYATPGASGGNYLSDGQSMMGQWLSPRGGSSSIDTGSLMQNMKPMQDAADSLGRQILPLIEDFKQELDRGLQDGNRRQR